MTRLPADQVRIGKGVNEEVAVEPVCSMPNCNERQIERHHAIRRSHLGGSYDAVEIDGIVFPNIIPLCSKHHREVTENRAMITFGEDQRWYWQRDTADPRARSMLFPQPKLKSHLQEVKPELEVTTPADRQPRIEQGMEPCPRCQGRGRLPKREKKLNATKKKYKTWAMGIPVDAGENGYEIWKTNLEQCSERIQDILGYSDTVPPYYVLIAVTADWLASQPVYVESTDP